MAPSLDIMRLFTSRHVRAKLEYILHDREDISGKLGSQANQLGVPRS